jgi:hypothetical protein
MSVRSTRIADLLDDDFSRPIDETVQVDDPSGAGAREAAALRVLRKKETQEYRLREMFRDCGASLLENVKLERCSRRTEFDEDQFVRCYPYLPHLMDLSTDIMAGIRLHPNAPKHAGGDNHTLVKQAFEMLASERTRLLEQPAGTLVSMGKIYDLVEGDIPPEKAKDISNIGQHFDRQSFDAQDHPAMAAPVAKAICLMEFAKTDLPRTTKNIAALLIGSVTEAPPTLAVAAILRRMKEAKFVHETEDGWKLYDFDELRRAAGSLSGLKNAIGSVDPRAPGWRNGLIRLVKKWLAPAVSGTAQHEFNTSVSRSVEEIVWSLDHIHMDVVGLAARLDRLEERSAAAAASTQEQLKLLHELRALAGSRKTENPAAPAVRVATGHNSSFRNDRTAYIIGLFGTGRLYINELILQNIGDRAKYFRDMIRLHPGPTPMIYSGHVTVRHVSRAQATPDVMSRLMKAAGAGFADIIFVYRHPLDSLLTNWVWWRTYIRENRRVSGISQVYKDTDGFCRDLEQEFSEFEAFAEGDPEFFASLPGPRFLSFPEFVEETELHLQSAALALRLEDFIIDPCKEFTKIVKVMSADTDLSGLKLAPPITKPYGYLAVQDKVPRFQNFIDGLNAETKVRIEKIGYKFDGRES